MASDSEFDLFVIGGGSGGVRAARIAAGHGARVAIAEEYRYGGTCVIRGCVPKKLLVYASRFRDEFEDAAGFGWTVPPTRFDWPTLIANKDKEITRLEGAYRQTLARAGVTMFDGRAVLVDRNTVAVGDKKVRAKTILIATGGYPFKPDIPGAEHAITSNEAFHLRKFPDRIAIVGGGYIAVEFACIFAGLGAAVTLVYRGEQILRGFDSDLRDGVAEDMRARGIDIRLGSDIAAIDADGAGYRIRLRDDTRLEVSQVMYATGRKPTTSGLGLDTVGVRVGSKGEIVVDEDSRSSVPSIYAVGDVTDRVNLTPVAIREGHAFADSVFGGRRWTVNHKIIPTGVFTTPEIGTVGLSEDAARAAGRRIDIYKSRFRPLKATLSGRQERMLLKLVVDAETDAVLGCHVLGADAAEIVQMAAIALGMGATKAQFDATMALHPSAAEEIVTMREKWQPPQDGPPARPVPSRA
ncbi:MAG: glutathione-disulfide reductase [Hyphomicrobiaceae bacterium]